MENKIVLDMQNISKQFAGVYALKNAQLTLNKGEVHALLGENGAGKSTLMKVLGGIYKADSGTIKINGEETIIHDVKDAQHKKISIIHQEIVLVPHLSVAENIFLGREPTKKIGFKDVREMNRQAQEMVASLGMNLDVTQEIFRLTIAQQQMVEIIKAVSFKASILVMDEPTSSLAEKEIKHLYEIIATLKSKGVSIIYISHKLDELYAVTDKITVMRDGEYVGTVVTAQTEVNELIKMMVGRELKEYYCRTPHNLGEVAIEVKNLCRKKVFQDVSFKVNKGEVVGFSGLVGAGRSEIMKAIFGVDSIHSGEVYLEGKKVSLKNVKDAMQHKIALVPEDRKKEGLILKNSVEFNILLSVQEEYKKGIKIDNVKKNEIVDKYVDAFSIKIANVNQIVNLLSGGNQQKVVISKWLATNPSVLILDEPTRGVDVGAKSDIYAIIDALAGEGMAIIIISSDLPEIINMCDRIYVVANGKITGELDKDEYSQEKIMNLSTGGI